MSYTARMMTIEEALRTSLLQTSASGLSFAVLEGPAGEGGAAQLARMADCVPRGVVQRLGQTACYFVPWLVKNRRAIQISQEPAPEGASRNELCHHLEVKPTGNLLFVSERFYQGDSYGLAMEFFDKVAYLAALQRFERDDFYRLLRSQAASDKGGELTPEAYEWRQELAKMRNGGDPDTEVRLSYERAAETDALGVYMASLFTDVFYEDLVDTEEALKPLPPEQLYERVRTLERLFPPNRGFSLQIVRQRTRRRG